MYVRISAIAIHVYCFNRTHELDCHVITTRVQNMTWCPLYKHVTPILYSTVCEYLVNVLTSYQY